MERIYNEYEFGILQDLVRKLNDDDRELVFNFFVSFSRLEYALIECGYSKGNQNWVDVDWDTFEDECQGKFQKLLDANRNMKLKGAVNYYQEKPPNKQVLENRIVCFKQENPPKEKLQFKKLMSLVRRVRNNLFHGEKLSRLLEGNSERDRELLQHGLVLLYTCLDINEDLKLYFSMQ